MTVRKSVLQIVRYFPDDKRLTREVRFETKESLTKAGEEVLEIYREIVSDWKNRPDFSLSVGVGQTQQFVRIFPVGSARAKTIFYSVDRGTKPRIIEPKNTKALTFMWGGYGSYKGRTTAVPSWGNPVSISNAKWFRLKIVGSQNKHSIKARNFESKVTKQFGNSGQGYIENAIRRASKKLKLKVR